MEKQKFQFGSEEHCQNVIFGGLSEHCLTGEMEKQIIENIKKKGYIRKSELQTLVDEAEERYKEYCKLTHEKASAIHMNNLIHELYNLCEDLKKSHPEFKS